MLKMNETMTVKFNNVSLTITKQRGYFSRDIFYLVHYNNLVVGRYYLTYREMLKKVKVLSHDIACNVGA